MKQENKLVNFAIFILIITIISTSFISGTYAKYTTTVTGVASAAIAKWSIKVEGTEIAVEGSEPTVQFNLFETVLDTDTTDGNEATEGELDVKEGVIAPGTQGSFDLDIENFSEVTATYNIELVATNTDNIPVKFSLDNGATYETWESGVPITINAEKNLEKEIGKDTITIKWKWEFEGDDTALGLAAKTDTEEQPAPQIGVQASITVTQVI